MKKSKEKFLEIVSKRVNGCKVGDGDGERKGMNGDGEEGYL